MGPGPSSPVPQAPPLWSLARPAGKAASAPLIGQARGGGGQADVSGAEQDGGAGDAEAAGGSS